MIDVAYKSQADIALKEKARADHLPQGYTVENMSITLDRMSQSLRSWSSETKERAASFRGTARADVLEAASLAKHQAGKIDALRAEMLSRSSGREGPLVSIWQDSAFRERYENGVDEYEATGSGLLRVLPVQTYATDYIVGDHILMRLSRNQQELQDRVTHIATGRDPRTVPGSPEAPKRMNRRSWMPFSL